MSSTSAKDTAERSTGAVTPSQVLDQAVQSFVQACDVQLGIALQPDGGPGDLDPATAAYGSCIACTNPSGGWNLVFVGDEKSCQVLARALFAMEEDEDVSEEDIADAMGEINNIAAGMLRAKRVEAGDEIQIGLPLFLAGGSCLGFLANRIKGSAQRLTGADGEVQVVIMWREEEGESQ